MRTPVAADAAARSSRLAVFRRGAPALRRGAGGLGWQGGRPIHRSRQRRSILPRARARLGRRRLAEGGRAGGLWRPVGKTRRAHDLRRARDSLLARQPRRFCLRHAGAGHRLDLALRQRRDQGQISAAGARGPPHRGLCAVGAGSRIRRQRAGDDRDEGRAGARAHRRAEDLDLQRRHRRPLRRVRAHRRGARRQGAIRLRRRRRHAGS